jgi:hypothetical protein
VVQEVEMTAVLDRRNRRHRTVSRRCLIDYSLDVALLAAFVVDMNVGFTGLAVHEWLGIGLAMVVVVHLMLHADWVERITRRILTTAPMRERVRWVVDLLLFVSFGLLVVTGILLSEVALPGLGRHDHFWQWLHAASAQWVVYLAAIHLGLSWRWIVRVTRAVAAPASRASGGTS